MMKPVQRERRKRPQMTTDSERAKINAYRGKFTEMRRSGVDVAEAESIAHQYAFGVPSTSFEQPPAPTQIDDGNKVDNGSAGPPPPAIPDDWQGMRGPEAIELAEALSGERPRSRQHAIVVIGAEVERRAQKE